MKVAGHGRVKKRGPDECNLKSHEPEAHELLQAQLEHAATTTQCRRVDRGDGEPARLLLLRVGLPCALERAVCAPVVNIVRVHTNGAAYLVKRHHRVARAVVRERREIVPPSVATAACNRGQDVRRALALRRVP